MGDGGDGAGGGNGGAGTGGREGGAPFGDAFFAAAADRSFEGG